MGKPPFWREPTSRASVPVWKNEFENPQIQVESGNVRRDDKMGLVWEPTAVGSRLLQEPCGVAIEFVELEG